MPSQRALVRVFDALAALAIIVALSPWGRTADAPPRLVVLLDLSRSVWDGGGGPLPGGAAVAASIADWPAAAEVSVVVFADRPVKWVGPVSPAVAAATLREAAPPALDFPWSTRVDRALVEASAILGADRPGVALLVTDRAAPDESGGVRVLVAAGHRVDIMASPLPPPADGDLFLADVLAPLRVAPGGAVRLGVVVDGLGRLPRRFRVVAAETTPPSTRGASTASTTQTAEGRFEGDGAVPLTLRFPGREVGVRTFEVRLEEPDAAPRQAATPADRATASVVVGAPIRVAWWGGESAGPLARLGAGYALIEGSSVSDVDVFIVADFARERIEEARALAEAVAHGSGLLALGSDGSFGPGGWQGSRLEAVLPVRIERPGDPADVTVFVDASGSMAADGRWTHAIRGVAALLVGLDARDRLRVFTFAADTTGIAAWHRVVRDADAKDAFGASTLAALRRVTPRGPTALVAALRGVLDADPKSNDRPGAAGAEKRIRRYVVLSDGALPEGLADYRALGTRLRAAGVELAIVTTRPGAETSRKLTALTAGGANGFVVTSEPASLGAAFSRVASEGWWLDGSHAVVPGPATPVAPPGGWPPVPRVSHTVPREDRGEVVASVRGSGRRWPALALGRHGRGRVAAFPVDFARAVAGAWATPSSWRPLITWLAGTSGRGPVGRVRVRSGRGTIDVSLPAGTPLDGWTAALGTVHTVLTPIGERRLRGTLRVDGSAADRTAPTVALARAGRVVSRLPIERPVGAERAGSGGVRSDLEASARAGGGCVVGPNAPIARPVGGDGRSPFWAWCAMGLLFFVGARGLAGFGGIKSAARSGR